MSEKKILGYKIVTSSRIEDYDSNSFLRYSYGESNLKTSKIPVEMQKGFNSLCDDAVKDVYVPFGEIKVTYSPTYVLPGTVTTLGGRVEYIREFVKYEE